MKPGANLKADAARSGYGFGTFQGVFTPSILTIIGVVMYLRFGWMLGNVGLPASLLIVTIGSAITFLTGLSISALATNMRMKGGGAYFILSRSLGLEAGAALGIPLALSQAVGVSFYVVGFSEALVQSSLPVVSGWDPCVVGLVTLSVLAAVATISADIALKSQYFIMAAIAVSLVSFFLGGTPEGVVAPAADKVPPPLGFWPVFAVFFPAVTGILSGLGMSGDLKNPGKSIPLGTLVAVLTGYAIYMSVPIALHAMVPDAGVLRSDTMILQKCARWHTPILIGVWAATLSSAVGSFLCAPRVLQALARDRLLPAFFARGFGKADDPRLAAVFCFGVAAFGIWLGDINVIAPVLTLFNLSTYGLLNFSAAVEEAIASPAWRPTFRVRAVFSLLGFAGCLAAMFMISPGWTFVAIFCEAAIYWTVKRRALKARWGDVRTGLFAGCVRFALRGLSRARHMERTWRPNLLVMADLPLQNQRILTLARAISGGKSLVTLATVLPPAAVPRAAELKDSVMRSAAKLELEAYVKMTSAADDWEGMSNLVGMYGFGPLVPNTLMIGLPQPEKGARFAEFLARSVAEQRNVLAVGGCPGNSPSADDRPGYIDIWWRGAGANGSFMLAIAFLLGRDRFARSRPRRVNMIIHRRTPEEARSELAQFLSSARVKAETRVIDSNGRPFTEIIAGNSSDAALTFVGLRTPRPDEPTASYADYFALLSSGLAGVSAPVFVLAAENIDFRRIFQ